MGTGWGFGGFNTQQGEQTVLGGLWSAYTAPAQSNSLTHTASALSAPVLLGDEKDGFWHSGINCRPFGELKKAISIITFYQWNSHKKVPFADLKQ